MDKNVNGNVSGRDGISAAIRLEAEKRRKEPKLLFYDFAYFALSFVFSRFHFLFGTYPLGLAFLAATPVRVWVSLLGALVGSISRGGLGVIHAIINIIVVFLRVVISGGNNRDEKRILFSEPLLLRLSSAVVGAFVGSVYELLLGGFSATSILYGASACIFGASFTVVFYGLFVADIGFDEIIYSKAPVFEKKRQGKAQYSWVFFQASFLTLIFLVSLALEEYAVFGIDVAFAFSGFITLLAAKRFGAVRAVVIGFVIAFFIELNIDVTFALT